jgi:hypothetical protein
MKTMKVLTLFCLLSLGFFCKSANAQMYIVTDSYSGLSGYDSVYVISPTGEITKYIIASVEQNNRGGVLTHYAQLNVILNSVISLGYKQMDVEINDILSGNELYELYYFAKQ